MYGANAQHTGLSPYDTANNTGALAWKYEAGAQLESSPVIGSDGTVYIDGLYAIGVNGELRWKFGGAWHPAIGPDGTVYVSSLDTLYAFGKSVSSDVFFPLLFLSLGAVLIVAVAMFVRLRKEKVKKEPEP